MKVKRTSVELITIVTTSYIYIVDGSSLLNLATVNGSDYSFRLSSYGSSSLPGDAVNVLRSNDGQANRFLCTEAQQTPARQTLRNASSGDASMAIASYASPFGTSTIGSTTISLEGVAIFRAVGAGLDLPIRGGDTRRVPLPFGEGDVSAKAVVLQASG